MRFTILAVTVHAALLRCAQCFESDLHVFSIEDVMGGFDGSTFGESGAREDRTILCGAPGSTTSDCPVSTMMDKEGDILYPIDSEFGFDVVDFLGAKQKTRNNDYKEGFAGNIMDGPQVIGVKLSNTATSTYKVKPPLGTWCQGLGGTSVKCSTEHYSVLEHVLSCHEVLPYFFANPVTGEQAVQSFPDGSASVDCADAELDNNLLVIDADNATADGQPFDPSSNPIDPNDSTSVLKNIATSTDYSITLKDDGKVLYRWGGLVKRPTDIRLYARLNLPPQWTVENAPNFNVTKAQLVVNHWVTNNPNDQLRPEDIENEAATGRKPDYRVEDNGDWTTTRDCFEGDGDAIDADDGSPDATPLESGTVLKNLPFAYPNLAASSIDPVFPLSADLTEGFTNAFYTTINRDPFEWSYLENDRDSDVFEFIGEPLPLSDADVAARDLTLVSGPRWRLKANKFGQDLPGLEIPLTECSEPPFESGNKKYETGAPATTVINLLDWDEEANGPSPLSTSQGWLDVTSNGAVTVADTVNGIPITTNGLPMTEDFDLAVYIKGDKKPTALFNARLTIEFDGEEKIPQDDLPDLEALAESPERAPLGEDITVSYGTKNLGPVPASGNVILRCTDNLGNVYPTDVFRFESLPVGDEILKPFTFSTSGRRSLRISCTVIASLADGPQDPVPESNIVKFKVKVRKSMPPRPRPTPPFPRPTPPRPRPTPPTGEPPFCDKPVKPGKEKCIRFIFEDEVTGKYIEKSSECLGPGKTAKIWNGKEKLTVDVTCNDPYYYGYSMNYDPQPGSGLRVREYQINYGDYCCYGPPENPPPTPGGKGGGKGYRK